MGRDLADPGLDGQCRLRIETGQMSLRIGITGASGYIGLALVACARNAGHEVVVIGRRGLPGITAHRYADLAHLPPDDVLRGLDAAVHLAADTIGGAVPADAEIRFATELALQAARRGLPLLVVSSQTASAQAPSAYGRTKAAIEQAVRPLGAVVVRPGQVYGGAPQGLYGQLLGVVRKLPMIPDLRPQPMLQPVHVDDLAAALLAVIMSRPVPGRVWCVAGPALPFDAFLAAIARHRLRVRRVRIPVPAWLLRTLLALAGGVLGPRFSTARLDSLIRLPPLDAEADLQALGIRLRPLADGLGPHGRPERRLLEEGRALMCGLLGHPPYPFALRRYVQAMRTLGHGRALPLPAGLLAHPALIASLDTRAFRRAALPGNLAWRYGVAIRILEAQMRHAHEFLHPPGQAGWLQVLIDGARMAARELHTRLLAPWARRLAMRVP